MVSKKDRVEPRKGRDYPDKKCRFCELKFSGRHANRKLLVHTREKHPKKPTAPTNGAVG